jgi:hypothetical protein
MGCASFRSLRCAGAVGLVLCGIAACASFAADEEKWTPLFDGKTLNGWKVTQFGGQGEVSVEEGELIIEAGGPMSGITYKGDFPKVNYEISLEAKRVEGTDFFCGLTMPVRDSHCSFIVGGWAGSVVGISSIDGHDASENDTTQVIKFNNGQWYKFKVRVTADKIETWIDGKQIVNQDIKGRKISTRNEVDLSKPLGLSTYQTKAAIRNIQYRKLP